MSLINKIKNSIEENTKLTCLYDDLGNINRRLDYADYPLCFFTLINRGGLISLNGIYREVANVVIFFVNTSTFDFESLENEQIIESCKSIALKWLDSLPRNGVLRATVLDTSRVYNYADSILTGYCLNLRIEELEGENCLNDLIPPERKKTVIFNIDGEGSITKDSGIYIVNTNMSVEAIPNQYYEFDGWYSDGVLLSSDPNYMFTVEEDITIDVKFRKIPLTITSTGDTSVILINSNDEEYELELSEGENKYYGDVEGFSLDEITGFKKTIAGNNYITSIDATSLGSWTIVGVQVFTYYFYLNYIILPNSITSVEQQAFYGCNDLDYITFLSITPPTLGYNPFDDTNNCPIYVPSESLDDYKTAWTSVSNRIQAITE